MNTTDTEILLTSFSKGSGCGCKIAPAVLREILKTTDEFPAPANLLVGYESSDDAAVLDLGNGDCLVSTTDFFMPVVNDAYTFGQVAAANALSDVYAMGGKPIIALAILGWPVDKLPAQLAQQVLEGARFICRMAGIALAGGHSVDSAEPLFGLAVNGLVKKENLKRNNTAEEGDLLFITKPLGTGIIMTAHKRGIVRQADYDLALSYMRTLNKVGEELGKVNAVTAMTDVTGFGLLGHLLEMCDHGRLSVALDFSSVPVIPGIAHYTSQLIYPDMTMKNYSAYSSQCNTLSAEQLFALADPQTSGGLLIAVKEKDVEEYLDIIRRFGLQGIGDRCIGKFIARSDKRITVA